jgi:hypothetical protein
VVDLGESVAGDGATVGGQSSGLGDFPGWVVGGRNVLVVFGVPVDTPQRGDEVFGGGASAACVAAADNVGFGVFGELLNL